MASIAVAASCCFSWPSTRISLSAIPPPSHFPKCKPLLCHGYKRHEQFSKLTNYKFLLPKRMSLKGKAFRPQQLGSSSDGSFHVNRAVHLAVSLGLLLGIDKALKVCFVSAGIRFPSALFGMFCIFSVLVVLENFSSQAADAFLGFFEPATTFIQRWLPLFYVPSLVVLPLAVKGIPAASGAKICAILAFGWLASLCVAGYTAISVRRIVRTEMIPAEPMPKPSNFSSKEIWFWGVVFISSFVSAGVAPTALGTTAKTCIPFLLAATALGYIIGSGFPPTAKKLLHPIITCALSADLAAFAYGSFSGIGFKATLGSYLTKAASNPGAGDILMGFLGSVILSFAFSMFRQRKLVRRHAVEIFSAVVVSTAFSLYSTAFVGRMVGLEPSLTISILPRCITVALALSIVSLFEGANPSLTAAVVVLTGLIGANFAQIMLDKLGLDDPIARGMATASSTLIQDQPTNPLPFMCHTQFIINCSAKSFSNFEDLT
eukprot:TRINITY_DN459_c0_g1_i2.p1 TRINITY_DN459_c0_g1~~TRINITY_DN459_c0_g1_i2.p1  ORF type:complete len:489 (-),score=56.99 TRINITY_DN459_c0_g1_i2:550-2016(-)